MAKNPNPYGLTEVAHPSVPVRSAAQAPVAPTPQRPVPLERHRILAGQWIQVEYTYNHASNTPFVNVHALIENDDGTFAGVDFSARLIAATTAGAFASTSRAPAPKNGHVVQFTFNVNDTTTVLRGELFVVAYVGSQDVSSSAWRVYDVLACGPAWNLPNTKTLNLDEFEDINNQNDWAIWVYRGTVAQDATAGTHISTLTVAPPAASELELLYGMITVGNSATAQVATAYIDDGTNIIAYPLKGLSTTTASLEVQFPQTGFPAAANITGAYNFLNPGPPIRVAGGMRLILRVTTTQVSITQTFSVVCRVKGQLPTATLADPVGTPTLATQTNAVF